MGRPSVQWKRIKTVKALVSKGKTVRAACDQVGIAPSTYYRHCSLSKQPRFSAVKRNWQALTEAYKPTGFGRIDRKIRKSLPRDVGQIFGTLFGRPVHEMTPAQRAIELRKLDRHMTTLIKKFDALNYTMLSELSLLADENSEISGPVEPAIERMRPYTLAIDRRIKDLAAAGKLKLSDAGGPRTDPRILSAVVRLADIFARHERRVPTHRTNPDQGNLESPFNRFVMQAFKHFLGDHMSAMHALRDAMQQVSARLDWDDEAKGIES